MMIIGMVIMMIMTIHNDYDDENDHDDINIDDDDNINDADNDGYMVMMIN